MTTPLYPTFKKRINDVTEKLIQEQITPWFFLKTSRPFRVKRFDGREISYEGIGFEGSPSNVFWSKYIEPFVEAIVLQEIAVAVASAHERNIDARLLLSEIQGLLISATEKIFSKMVEVDNRLLANGFPKSNAVRSATAEIAYISEFIDEHIMCELTMWKSKSTLEMWYEHNKFWTWLIGFLIAIIGLSAKFF